jgi:membrane-associated protease RseP (regulator of RpoE activity)
MSNKQLNDMAEEAEILTAEDRKLRQMLGGLKKVNAPANFDFQLKARIANAEKNHSPRPFLLPALRFVMPLSVIVLLAGFVFFNLSFSDGVQNEQIAQIAPTVSTEAQSVSNPAVSNPIEQATAAPVNKNIEAKTSVREIARLETKAAPNNANYIRVKGTGNLQKTGRESNSDNGFGGTREGGLSIPKVLTQKSSNPKFGAAKPPLVQQSKISLQGVLLEIGIEANFDEKNWKILSIKENSPAMRAGFKSGDLIESIDDKQLSSDAVLLQKFSGKVFRILREGQQMIIDLTVKQ